MRGVLKVITNAKIVVVVVVVVVVGVVVIVVVVVVVVVVVSLTFWSKVLFYFIFGASGAVFLTTP